MTCNDPIKNNCTCFVSSVDDAVMCGCRIGYEAVMVSGSSICQGENAPFTSFMHISYSLESNTINFTDIDECAGMGNPCHGGSCVNTPGSYLCICLPGYTVDPVKESCVGEQ